MIPQHRIETMELAYADEESTESQWVHRVHARENVQAMKDWAGRRDDSETQEGFPNITAPLRQLTMTAQSQARYKLHGFFNITGFEQLRIKVCVWDRGFMPSLFPRFHITTRSECTRPSEPNLYSASAGKLEGKTYSGNLCHYSSYSERKKLEYRLRIIPLKPRRFDRSSTEQRLRGSWQLRY